MGMCILFCNFINLEDTTKKRRSKKNMLQKLNFRTNVSIL